MSKAFVLPPKAVKSTPPKPVFVPKPQPEAAAYVAQPRIVTKSFPKEPFMKKGEAEVDASDYFEDGRRELDRVCKEKGLVWGLINTTWKTEAGKTKIITRVIVGNLYENEYIDERGNTPNGMTSSDRPYSPTDACLLALAKELEDGT